MTTRVDRGHDGHPTAHAERPLPKRTSVTDDSPITLVVHLEETDEFFDIDQARTLRVTLFPAMENSIVVRREQ